MPWYRSSAYRAFTLGCLAAYVASLSHWVVRHWTQHELEFGIMGLAVGWGVHIGSRKQRSRAIAWMAVGLAYASIATTYIPKIGQAMLRPDAPWTEPESERAAEEGKFDSLPAMKPRSRPAGFTPKSVYDHWLFEFDDLFRQHIRPLPFIGRIVAFWGIMFLLACMAPFLYGQAGVIRLALIALALWEAWRINRPLPDDKFNHPFVS